MTEPGDHYLNEASSSSSDEKHGVTAMDEPTNRVKPSKKASMLKVLSTPRRKLTVQGAGVQVRRVQRGAGGWRSRRWHPHVDLTGVTLYSGRTGHTGACTAPGASVAGDGTAPSTLTRSRHAALPQMLPPGCSVSDPSYSIKVGVTRVVLCVCMLAPAGQSSIGAETAFARGCSRHPQAQQRPTAALVMPPRMLTPFAYRQP